MARTISIRLGIEQAAETKAALEAIGSTGSGALDKLRAGLERLGKAGADVPATLQRIQQAAERVQAATAQAQTNAFAGVKAALGGDDLDKRAAKIADYGAELDRLRAKFNPLYAASKQYSDTLDEIARAQKVGAISSAEAEQAQARVTQAFSDANAPIAASTKAVATSKTALEEHAKSSGAAAASARNMGIQFIQGFSGIATGQPVLTTLIQQGHQVVDTQLAMGTGIKGTADAFRGMIAGIGGLPTLLTVGLVGGLAAFTAAAEHSSNRMADLRQSLRLTHDDYVTLADQVDASARRVAASSTLTRGAAEEIGKAIATSQHLGDYSGNLDALTKSAADFARVAGIDGPAAGKLFRQAIDEPAKAAQHLADISATVMDPALLRMIQRLDASGRSAEATALALQAMTKGSAGAAGDLGPISKALNDISNALTGTNDGLKGLGEALTGSFAAVLSSTATDLNNLLDVALRIKRLGESIVNNAGVPVDNQAAAKAIPAEIQPAMQAAAARFGLDPNFLAAIHALEGVQDGKGGWVTSSAGARGPMQVMPGTFTGLASRYGITGTIDDPGSNIMAGAAYLREMLDRFHDPKIAAAAYNAGPGRAAEFLAGGTLPNETQGYVRNFQSIYDGPGILGAPQGGVAPRAAAPPASAVPAIEVTPRGLPESVQRALGTGRDGTVLATQQDSEDRIAALVRAIGDLDAAGEKTGPTMDRLQALLAKARGEFAGAIQPIDAVTRGITDQLAPLQAQSGAARAVAEAINAQVLAARASGQEVTAGQAAAAEAATLQTLAIKYDDNVKAIDRQISAQQRVNDAYAAAGGNVIDITARTQAEAEARETAIPGTRAYGDQVETLTRRYAALATSQAALGQIQANQAAKDNIAYIQAETNTIGMSEEARTKLLTVMKAEQDLHRRYGEVLPQEAKEYLNLVAAQADATASYKRQQDAMNELSGFAERTFGIIGDAITQAFATGSLKAIKFGDIAKSVMSAIVQEIGKLAILNPILNTLFGGNRVTLGSSSVGGLLGGLLGNSSSSNAQVAISSSTSAASLAGLLGAQGGLSKSDVDGLAAAAAGAGSGGGVGLFQAAGAISTIGKTLLGSGASISQAVVSGVTTAFGNLAASTNIALSAAGSGVYGVATAGQVAAASIADAAGLGASTAATVTSAVGSIAQALPYIGAAISVVTAVAQGNYRGAGLIAGGAVTGAAIGSVIPVIGTAAGAAVGAVIGGLVDAFLPNHPKNPYQSVGVDVVGGQLAVGKVVAQLENPANAKSAVADYAQSVNAYLAKTGIAISNPDGRIGGVGQGIKGFEQVDNPSKLFAALGFRNADPNDTGNFGVAKGALEGMHFTDLQSLHQELLKIGGFADGLDALGIHLAKVGVDLQSIQIASVDLHPGLADGVAVTQETDLTNPHANDLRVALAHALPNRVFADQDALQSEITKVNDFVNGVLPSLFDPKIQVAASDWQKGIQRIYESYQQASAQATAYGLSIDGLAHAADVAVQQFIAPAVQQLAYARYSLQARNLRAGGKADDGQQADLIDFDVRAAQERTAYSKALTDVYSDAYAGTAEYVAQMAYLEETLGKERIQIVQKYAEQTAQAQAQAEAQAAQARAQALASAQQSAGAVVVSLTEYARGLVTGQDSPLSPQRQLDEARRQFQAVAGAADAGDAGSIQKLQSYAESYKGTARAVYGSGVGYADAISQITDAIAGVAGLGQDALTQSFMAAAIRSQTDMLVSELQALRGEVNALRRETQAQTRNAALAA